MFVVIKFKYRNVAKLYGYHFITYVKYIKIHVLEKGCCNCTQGLPNIDLKDPVVLVRFFEIWPQYGYNFCQYHKGVEYLKQMDISIVYSWWLVIQ